MKRPRQRSFLSFEKAASEAMPPVPPQMFPRISTISPIGGERSNAAARTAVRRRGSVTRAPRSRARLIPVTNRRRLMAKPCTPHFHCAARAVLQAQSLQCRGSRGTPLAFLWGFQRGYSLRKENTPFNWQWRKAPHDQCSAGRRCTPTPSKGGSKGSTDSDEHTDPVRQQRDDAARDDDAEEDDRHGAL